MVGHVKIFQHFLDPSSLNFQKIVFILESYIMNISFSKLNLLENLSTVQNKVLEKKYLIYNYLKKIYIYKTYIKTKI